MTTNKNARRRPNRSWVQKFRDAARGVKIAVRGEASYFVHFFVTATVILAAGVYERSPTQWCLLILCITAVLAAETLNTAIERLARAVSVETHPELRDALDIASGAVLLASLGAATVGLIVFSRPLLTACGLAGGVG